MTFFAVGALPLLVACSRTSDGTIVVPETPRLPGFDMTAGEKLMPSWMKKQPEPEMASANFPPAPETESRPAPRRSKVHSPVVTSSSGKLSCKNVGEAGRVRMVCK